MAYRANVSDTEQDNLELADFEGGSPVFTKDSVSATVTRIIAKGFQTSAEREIGGVILPPSDALGRFEEALIGR